jgi:poly(3-hydroxybutyrate) depolymerase
VRLTWAFASAGWCETQEQYHVLTQSNPDVEYLHAVLESMKENLPINVNQVYLMGSGNGAELAYQVLFF